MKRLKEYKERKIPFTFSIEEKIMIDFRTECANMGEAYSKVLRNFIIKFLKDKKNNKK